MTTTASELALTTIDDAIAPYRGVNRRMVWAWIKAGRLPATKLGRSYLIDPRDLSALLRPTVRAPAPKSARETPTQRTERQLRQAGIG